MKTKLLGVAQSRFAGCLADKLALRVAELGFASINELMEEALEGHLEEMEISLLVLDALGDSAAVLGLDGHVDKFADFVCVEVERLQSECTDTPAEDLIDAIAQRAVEAGEVSWKKHG